MSDPEQQVQEAWNEQVVEKPAVEAPAQDVAQPDAEQAVDKVEKVVPLAALHEARAANRTLREQMREQAEKQQMMEQRLSQIYEAKKAPPPAFDENPAEHLKHVTAQHEAALAQLVNERQASTFAAHQQAQEAQLASWGGHQAQEFRTQTGDYDDAYKFVRDRRATELQAVGMAPDQIADELRRNELWLIANAYRSGKNPAEMIYGLAKQTGWAGKQSNEAAMDKLEKGAAAAKSVARGGQKAPGMTFEALASMSNDDFKQALKDGVWEKLGGA